MLDRNALQTLLLAIIAGVTLLAALDAASLIAVPTVLALLCAIALAPTVRLLEGTGAPASLCAALVVASLLLGAATAVYFLAPSAEAWNERAPQILREVERRARVVVSGLAQSFESEPGDVPRPSEAGRTQPAAPPAPGEEIKDGEKVEEDTVGKLVEGGQRLLADWAIGAPRMVGGTAYWAMLTFFLLSDRVMLARWGMSLAPGSSARRAIGRAMRDVRESVARYLLAITIVNIGLGVCTAAVFHLFGVANAPLWGVTAALLNFMPFIGIAIMALITLGVGIVTFDAPVLVIALLAAMFALNAIESQIVMPLVVGSSIRIPPIAVFMAIAFGAWLWGGAGALVATPTLIVAFAFVRRLNAAVHLSRSSRQHKRSEESRERKQR